MPRQITHKNARTLVYIKKKYYLCARFDLREYVRTETRTRNTIIKTLFL